MLIQPTLDKLNALKLNGMAIALSDQMTHNAAQGLAFEERLALLLDRESLYRENRRMTQRHERALRSCPAAVRGTDPLPCRRKLPQAARRNRQNQRLDHRRFCDSANRAAGA